MIRITSKVESEYQLTRYGGNVDMRVIVSADAKIKSLTAPFVAPDSRFLNSAKQALEKWTFEHAPDAERDDVSLCVPFSFLPAPSEWIELVGRNASPTQQ
jgi:hypothetical protein